MPVVIPKSSSATIHPGYMGYASIAGYGDIPISDCSINIKQEPLFYDHLIGLRDSRPSGIYSNKTDSGQHNPQKIFMRPGVKIVQGGISFHWIKGRGGVLFKEAAYGDTISDITVYYSCDYSRSFSGCKVNTYNFKAYAGELVISSADIIGKGMTSKGSGGGIHETNKLITWDAVKISCDFSSPIAFIEFTINNNCIPIYTSGGNLESDSKLQPFDIRVGMQNVTGVIGCFSDKSSIKYFEEIGTHVSPITINVDTWSAQLNVIYKPVEQSATTTPIITAHAFQGVDVAIQ
jgi:hypothetical protein